MLAYIAWHDDVETQLLRAARDHAPQEFAAVLGGEVAGSTAHVRCLLAVRNDAEKDDAFVVDAIEFARCEYELRRTGLTLLGFAHSHPHGSTMPSARDRQQLWTDYVQVITDAHASRAFILAADRSVHMLVATAQPIDTAQLVATAQQDPPGNAGSEHAEAQS